MYKKQINLLLKFLKSFRKKMCGQHKITYKFIIIHIKLVSKWSIVRRTKFTTFQDIEYDAIRRSELSVMYRFSPEFPATQIGN